MKRIFVIIDGLDGIGKGEVENAIKEYEQKKGTHILDLKDFWKAYHKHPEIHEIENYNMLISAEPTRTWIGASIRGEITAENKRSYSALSTAHAFALDRLVLMKRVILPALEKGIKVLQSRSVVSSLVYQQIQAQEQSTILTPQDIINIEGNKFQLENPPSLVIIPTIDNAEEVIKRLSVRLKRDTSQFENLEFQKKLKPLYESKWLKDLLKSYNINTQYLDVGISLESTRSQAIALWKKHIEE